MQHIDLISHAAAKKKTKKVPVVAEFWGIF